MNDPQGQSAELEFWFDFASPYSYIAAMRIEELCRVASIPLRWRPFLLGPIFQLQGWNDSHYNLNPLRGAYMWRDLERLTSKFAIPWRKPAQFPRNSTLAGRVGCVIAEEPIAAPYVRATFVANFGEDQDISDEAVIRRALTHAGGDAEAVFPQALSPAKRGLLRSNTERAMQLGIFGAPNCVVKGELFWGEEALEDAIQWSKSDR